MQENNKIFKSFWFIFGLAILLLNDFILKDVFGNWLTGKLSDFSGLFVFALFWVSFFPKHRVKIIWITGLVFIFWKSSLSQSFIDSWNNFGLLNLSRTIDYSDLIALVVLPIANYYDINISKDWTLRINPTYSIALSAFAFMATSYSTNVNIDKTYRFEFPKDTLVNRINRIDSLNHGYDVILGINNPDTVYFSIPSNYCFHSFDVHVSITEIDSTSTIMKLISAEHGCPEDKKDKEELTNIFEAKIIDRIKDGF